MRKPITEDISNLAFQPGTIRENPNGKWNVVNIAKKALDNLGVAYPNSGAASKTDILSDIEDIATYTDGSTDTIFVSNGPQAGQFYLYEGDDEPDNGMIFEDGDGRKWMRNLLDNRVNIRWYGAGAAQSAVTNYNAIIAARDFIYAHPEKTYKLFIPADNVGNGKYNISETLLFTQSIFIEGEGLMNSPTTKLSFPWNTTGIFFKELFYDYVAEMRNLSVENADGIAPRDTTKPLIDVRCKVMFDNIKVPQASGVGINLEACGGGDHTSNPIFGNCDYSILHDCVVTFALHGFRTAGCDSNYSNFYNCEAGQCMRWGFYDNGMLGNNFYGCKTQANSNASIAGTATTVTYGGLYYTSTTYGDDDDSNINQQPDISPLYWAEVSAQSADPWDDTTTYYSGGARITLHPSATSQWYGPYDEGDQPGPSLNTRSIQIGGVRGAGTPAGTILRDQGSLVLYGNFATILPQSSTTAGAHLVINNSEATASPSYTALEVHNMDGETYIGKFMSDNAFAFLYFGTSGGGAEIGGYQDKARISAAGGVTLTTIPEYADNAAALLAGLTAGDVYRTGDILKITH